MKLTILLLITSVFTTNAKTYSQNVKLTYDLKDVTVATVLEKIEKDTKYKFLFNNEEINGNRIISVTADNEELISILDKIFLNSNITYKVKNKQIILKENKVLNKVVVDNTKLVIQIIVKGTVKDADGFPIPGANVLVKGSTIGTTTDIDGNYALSVPDTAKVLVFSYLGLKTTEVEINGRSIVNISLQSDAAALDEVVVIGYGTESKNEATGAATSIKAKDIVTQGSSNVENALQGKISGVQIESAGGNPGSGVRILIRGTGSLGNNTPLYIVDGVQVDNVNNISPSDIASMNVLKDASAAAIYGSRAANGVVIITTKTGVKGETKISFDAYYGVQNVAKKLDVLNASQWATVSNAAHDNAGLARLDLAKNPSALGKGTDWQDQIYRTAPTKNYNLNVSGGGENSTFSLSGGYLSQDGIVIKTGYERMNLRLKSEITKGRFKIGETLILSNENTNGLLPGWGQGQGGNAAGSALKMIPVFNVYDPNAIGGYAGATGPIINIINPVAQSNLFVSEANTKKVVLNVYLETDIFKGLTYKFNTGYTNANSYNYNYVPPYKIGTFFTNLDADLTELRDESKTTLLEHTLTYDIESGKSRFKALLGYTYQNSQYRSLTGSKSGMPNGVNVLDAGTTNIASGSNANENVLISYFGRAIYSYDDKYVVTGIIRRDGSSRFGKSNRYGNFPSIAMAWNISNEDFFNKKSFVSNAKFRMSYGVLGSQNFSNYVYNPSINLNANYVTGQNQTLWPGAIQSAFATPDVKWETSKTLNIGGDVSFFDSKLKLTADYFIKKNSDILLQVPIPLSTGASGSSPYVNAGQITNKGLEVSLSYSNSINEFQYQFSGSIAVIKNNVDMLGSGTQQIFGGQPTIHDAQSTLTQAGGPVGAFYLIKADGLFQSQQEIDSYAKNGQLIQPNARPGDVRFIDYNNDSKIDQNDRQFLGSPTPDFTFGFGGNFSWKGFDMNLYFQGTQGNKIYNGSRQDLEGMDSEYNYASSTLNAWTPTNTNTDMPRAVINDPNGNDQTSSRFLESGSYLRLKTLQIGYNFSDKITKKLGLSNLRFYVSANNLFTLTNYKGFNPDLGGSGSVLDRGVDFGPLAYPLSSTYLTGLQLSF